MEVVGGGGEVPSGRAAADESANLSCGSHQSGGKQKVGAWVRAWSATTGSRGGVV